MIKNEKGQALQAMTGLALFLVVIIVGTSLGANIVQNINDNVPDNSSADNVTTLGNQGLQQFSELAPVLGIATIAVITLGVLKMLM